MPSVAAAERVRDARAGRPRDDRARRAPACSATLVVLPEQEMAVALEDDEDLLLGRVAVRRRVELPGKHLGVAEPGPLRAGRRGPR